MLLLLLLPALFAAALCQPLLSATLPIGVASV
jgi:hypothetical protein